MSSGEGVACARRDLVANTRVPSSNDVAIVYALRTDRRGDGHRIREV